MWCVSKLRVHVFHYEFILKKWNFITQNNSNSKINVDIQLNSAVSKAQRLERLWRGIIYNEWECIISYTWVAWIRLFLCCFHQWDFMDFCVALWILKCFVFWVFFVTYFCFMPSYFIYWSTQNTDLHHSDADAMWDFVKLSGSKFEGRADWNEILNCYLKK
jgi:hypothetical protein